MGTRRGSLCAVVSVAVAALAFACGGPGSIETGEGDGGANPTGDGSSGGDSVPANMQGLLDLHNTARAEVIAPALAWHAELAADAQSWVDGCQIGHDPDRSFQGEDFGENIAGGSGGFTLVQLAQQWVDEKANYDCPSNSCSGGCGHYTQVIWADSRDLGCAVASCGGANFLACRYLPAGNFIGLRPVPEQNCP